jgi:SulP family sulfate permease
MITPIIAALFGSSFHLISGPTTAISIVVFSAVSKYAAPGSPEFISIAITLTFLAGVYQLAFGLARLGVLVNFVSHTVVIGFTAGAAVLIATSQLKHITGIPIKAGSEFLHTWMQLIEGSQDLNIYLLLIALATLVISFMSKKMFPKVPNLLVGMVLGSVLAVYFSTFAEGIKFVGKIPAQLPPLSAPDFSLATIKMLAPQAFAIALLGLIEAVSISRAVATKSGQRINANQEFIGQGMSNLLGSFFSSYAGSGSFTRSGINYEAGAKTPLSALFAALALMGIVLLIAPLTAYLPIAAMGGVILLVAYNLIDFHHIKQVLHASKTESAVLLTTFLATLFLELEFAIYLGVLLSLVMFLAKTSIPEIPALSIDAAGVDGRRKFIDLGQKPLLECPQLKIIRIDRSIYFGSINRIQDRLAQITDKEGIANILIIATGINMIDLAGVEALIAEHNRLRRLGGGLYFVDMKPAVYEFAAKVGLIKKIGIDHFFDAKNKAIATIHRNLDQHRCANCKALLFRECQPSVSVVGLTKSHPKPKQPGGLEIIPEPGLVLHRPLAGQA